MPAKNGVQLITYAGSLGGNLGSLNRLLNGRLADLFPGGVHILPPFPSSADRGFAPITYYEIDPAFGTWDDVAEVGRNCDVTLDVMVNHISRQSPYFVDFARKGRASPWADLFVTVDKVWPDSRITPEDVAKIARRKPGDPFSDLTIEESGVTERVWTTFGSRDPSEQIDLDVRSRTTRGLLTDILGHFARHGVKMARLDAVGYVIKKRGTSCFFVEPEIHEFLSWMKSEADVLGIGLLAELHARLPLQEKMASLGFWIYDFALPALLLHSFRSSSADALRGYLRIRPGKQFTTLDCHDGIPIQPDLDGLLAVSDMKRIVDSCLSRGANLSRLRAADGREAAFDAHQVNCTYYDALGRDDDAYVAARAIQFFVPGIPQVYYVGLLAGENDYGTAERTGSGKAVNRHDFSCEEIETALEKPVVKRLLSLIRFRNGHPSFQGAFSIVESDAHTISLEWRNGGAFCSLEVDFKKHSTRIRHTDRQGGIVEWIP